MPLFGTFASGALWIVESFTSHEMTLGSVFRIQRVERRGWGEKNRNVLPRGERLMWSFMNFIDYNDLGNRLVLEKIRGGD